MEIESLADLPPDRRRELFERDAGIEGVREEVDRIVTRVSKEGDAAVRAYSEEFDDVSIGNIDVTGQLERAVDAIDSELRDAIRSAVDNVRTFHERQLRTDWRERIDGRELGRRFRPIDRVGAYVPGGTAAYPSSAIMTVTPAKVAGVEEVAVTTPPGDPVNNVTLAALSIAGADEVYQVGGAQAIAAMAYGTESIPSVLKIVGPGNPWVTAAKAAVRNQVEIDLLAGPSEILVIADETARPGFIAADLIAQAEHGPGSPCVLVTDDRSTASAVLEELDARMGRTRRTNTIEQALSHPASGVFLARSMSEAISFAETFAPEHLSIQAADDEAILDRIHSAGSVFLGPHSPVAVGDYASGTNHVLPTGGTARVTGGLSVDSFLRATTIQRLDASSLTAISDTVTRLAEAEGLPAHAESVRVRRSQDPS